MITATVLERQNDNVTLDITIPEEEIKEEIERVFKQLSKNRKVPGFRPGKAPKEVLMRVIGIDNIHSQVLNQIIPKAYSEALKIVDMAPLETPRFETDGIVEGKPLTIKTFLEVTPTVELLDYENELKLPPQSPIIVEEAEIANHLKNIMLNKAKWIEQNDKPCEMGNTLKINLTIREDDSSDKNIINDQKNIFFTLGSGELPIETEQTEIVGMRAGEKKSFAINFSQDTVIKSFRNKTLFFELELLGIMQPELPELDDTFARSLGNFQNLDDLKERIKKDIYQMKEITRENQTKSMIISELLSKCSVQIPQKLVDIEVNYLISRTTHSLTLQDITLEKFLKQENKTFEEFHESLKPQAYTGVKQRLIYDAIFKKANLSISNEEIDKAIDLHFKISKYSQQQQKKLFSDENFRAEIFLTLKDTKVINLLRSKVQFIGSVRLTGPDIINPIGGVF